MYFQGIGRSISPTPSPPTMGRLVDMDVLVTLLVIGGLVALVVGYTRRRQATATERSRLADLAAVRTVAEEDVTRFGEELQRLDLEMLVTPLDEATRQDYQRALDSYEAAKAALQKATEVGHLRHVTESLEDGRYAAACVLARRDGRALPVRRPPCFFNPAHGPSTTDVEWAPPAGIRRPVPVCAADADRVAQGAEPDIRTVPQGHGRIPYWQAGPAYSPWASGYFGAYTASNLLPTFLLLTLLSPTWDGGAVEGADTDFGAGAGGEGSGLDGPDGYEGQGGEYGGDEPRYAEDDLGQHHDGGWDLGSGFSGDFGGF